MWYIQQNWCAFPLFDCVMRFLSCGVSVRSFSSVCFLSSDGCMNECRPANRHTPPVPPSPRPDVTVSPLYPAFLTSLLSKPALSSTLPFLTAQPTIHTIISQSASTIFRMSLLVSKKKKKKKTKQKNAKVLFQNYWLLFVA